MYAVTAGYNALGMEPWGTTLMPSEISALLNLAL